jgi:hypothetical protein
MALDDVAPVLAKEYIPLKLDFDRQKGAKEIQERYAGKPQGLPWFVFVGGDGQAIVTSTGPKGNVGMPWEPHEVAHFKTMLQRATHLTASEVERLIASIQDFRKRTDAK